MQLSRCLAGQTPYKTNIRVYDSGTLEDGALMMWNPTYHSSGAPNSGAVNYFIKAAADDATEAIDAIGVLQASSTNVVGDKNNLANDAMATKIGTDYYADAGLTVGGNYLPCIISPEVLYFAEYYQIADADSGVNVVSVTSASASTTLTITDLQDHLDGGFIYSTKLTDSAAPNPGQLRYVTVSAATGSCTIDSAATYGTSDDVILILPQYMTRTGLTDDGVGLRSLTDKTADDPSVGLGISIQVWDNYGQWDSAPTHPLRYWKDKGLNGLKRTRFKAEIRLTDHLWNVAPA